jgi:tetratricopeptide (TPR) repeat protein
MRYIAGKSGPLDDSWTVTKCQFDPNALRCFNLVWQNDVFRVFRLRMPTDADTTARHRVTDQIVDDNYEPMFDPRNFDRGARGYVNTLASEERILRAARSFNEGLVASELSQWSRAEEQLNRALQECPNYLAAWLELAYVAHMQNQSALELRSLTEAQRIAPLNREVERRIRLLPPAPPSPH